MSERLLTRDLALAAVFAALTGVGALIAVPFFGPVPFTLQVLFVLLAGLVLGPRLAALSMLAYIVLGLVAPVYAGGASGIGTLVGPAGGYIWGFVLGAALVGYLAGRLEAIGVARLTLVAAVGLVPIYALGAGWLAISLRTFDFVVIFGGGVLQFLPMDVLKAFAAVLAFRALVATPARLPIVAIRDGRLARRTAT
jgi:biotin transport system substrate-specific component